MTIKKNIFSLLFIVVFLLLIPCYGAPKSKKDKRKKRAQKAAIVKKYPPRQWEDAFKYESKYYLVKTNTSKQTASYIGQLMDYAQKNYRKIFGYTEKIKKLDIHAFRTLSGYLGVGEGLANSCGIFTWNGTKSAINVAYVDKWGKTFPTEILLHEGTHQFVHEAIDFKLPMQYRESWKNILYLNVVPRWLNEGMATYIEVSYYDGKRLVVGEINRKRLRYLQYLIKTKKIISLRDLFKPRTSTQFIDDKCYSPAWGLIYWFLHDKKKSTQIKRRKMLKKYIDWCKKGFMNNPEVDFGTMFFNDKTKAQNFWKYWKKHTEVEGFKKFIEVTIGDESKIEAWEKLWHKYILSLNPGNRWGGLRSKKKR